MPYELKYEDVMVCGEKLTVYQASNAMDMERSFLIAEAQTQPSSGDTKDQFVYYMQTLLYPSLVACTTGNIPTWEEFLNNVPTDESNKWTDAARRMNPSWFGFLNLEEIPEEKKEV